MSAAQTEWGTLVHAMGAGTPNVAATPDAEEGALAAWLRRTVIDDVDATDVPGAGCEGTATAELVSSEPWQFENGKYGSENRVTVTNSADGRCAMSTVQLTFSLPEGSRIVSYFM